MKNYQITIQKYKKKIVHPIEYQNISSFKTNFIECSFQKIPSTQKLLKNIKIPLIISINPFGNNDKNLDEEIKIINVSSNENINENNDLKKCQNCGSFLNPFSIIDGFSDWKCNICQYKNHLNQPEYIFGSLKNRPEYQNQVIDSFINNESNNDEFKNSKNLKNQFNYLFVIDFTKKSVSQKIVSILSQNLFKILQNKQIFKTDNTRIGFVTFDYNSVCFYNLSSKLNQPKVCVARDLSETFCPINGDDLLFNIQECEQNIMKMFDNFVDQILNNNNNNHININQNASPFAFALESSLEILKVNGGKILLFLTQKPESGKYGIDRIYPKNTYLGPEKEVTFLQPDPMQSKNYEEFSYDCLLTNISVSFFLFSSNYFDIPTISLIAKNTQGEIFRYLDIQDEIWEKSFRNDLKKSLHQFATQARLYLFTNSLQILNNYSKVIDTSDNYVIIPFIEKDHSFLFEMEINEKISTNVYIQAILFYNSFNNEKRIRIMNKKISIENSILNLYNQIEPLLICDLWIRKAILIAQKQPMFQVNWFLKESLIEIFKQFSKNINLKKITPSFFHENIPKYLQLLSLFTSCLPKNIMFRIGKISNDERSYFFNRLNHSHAKKTVCFLYPIIWQFYETESTLNETRIISSKKHFKQDCIHLMTNSEQIIIYIGKFVSCNLLMKIFSVQNFDELEPISFNFKKSDLDHEFKQKILNLIEFLQFYLRKKIKPIVLKQTEENEKKISHFFSEDRIGQTLIYGEFVEMILRQIQDFY
ncbi:sec24-related protein [Anaeramoeba ignava]|uniref:Sec24-related protein n=1 Tax=Anaeramoeba ignava TaxID=1746090 RepID=A0A9Q0LWM2_ANAIG|nr:sec24-related protein [Anaeramoeba ignava]